MEVLDEACKKYEDLTYIHEWAKLYNEYFIFTSSKLNLVFAKILNTEDTADAIELIYSNSSSSNDFGFGGDKYSDWWEEDCQSAFLTDGTDPKFWMKKRLLQIASGQSFFEEKESERLKKEADKIPNGKMVKAGVVNENAGYVYVIRDMDSGLYKIGETTNWRRRFKELKVDDEKIVAIQLKWVSNRLEIEKYHHDLHSAYRLPQSEWFKLSKSPNL